MWYGYVVRGITWNGISVQPEVILGYIIIILICFFFIHLVLEFFLLRPWFCFSRGKSGLESEKLIGSLMFSIQMHDFSFSF